LDEPCDRWKFEAGGDTYLGGPEGLEEETCREGELETMESQNNEGSRAEGSGGKGRGSTSFHRERGDKGKLVLAREKTPDCAATCTKIEEWKELVCLCSKLDWDANDSTYVGEGS